MGVVALVLAGMAVVQPAAVDTRQLLGQSEQTAKRLAEAERTLVAGKASDALEQLLRIVDEAGDDLVSADGTHYRPARRVAQQTLVKLPPPVLRTYRDRVAGPADALLAAGTRDRDPRPLHTLLDRYFPAARSEPALLLLGDLLFERGEFRAAEQCWRRLLPDGDAAGDPPVPDRTADPARVRALLALAVKFQGVSDPANGELATLRKLHPTAAGRLAGVDGVYADTVKRLAATSPRPTGGGEWTAFAGNTARDGRVTGRLPRYWPTRPTWQTKWPTDELPPAVLPTATARSVAYHPVVLNGVGYIADPLRVFAFDPLTGVGRVAFDVRREGRFQALPMVSGESVPTVDADFTLTAADGRLFGRFGAFPPPGVPDQTARPSDFLLCLAPVPGQQRLMLRWSVPPPAREGLVAAWEAAPVWLAGRVYAAFTRLEGTTRAYAVAAYADPPGDKPLWVTEVATAPAAPGPRVRQEPLTVAGGKLVYCTHAGSVVALDPLTGKPAWAVRYPQPESRRKLPVADPPRDLCPPLAAGGRVFVAPTDADRLMALDAGTGKELWAADGLMVDQLLGLSRGRLVATLAGPQKGVRGFDAATGDDRGLGWRQHDDPRLGSFGRGLVTDDLVLWPTRNGLFALDADTGRPVSQPLPGAHGNLAFADGVLLVGTPTGVAGFVPDSLRQDGSPRSRAVALADAGRVEEAVAVVTAAGLPDAGRLAGWWRPVAERPSASPGRPLEAPPPPDPPTRFDPASLTALGPDVSVTGVTRFPAPVQPLRPFTDEPGLPGLADRDPLLLVTDGPRVLAYRPGGTRPVWVTPLPAGVAVNRAATLADDVIAVGPGAALRLARADGRLIWCFTPPPAPRLGPRPSRPPLPPVLADFTLAGTRLCCRYGGHAVLGIDLANGNLAWARDGQFLRFDPIPVPSAVGFTHLVCLDGHKLLARRTDGKLLALEPTHGDVLGTETTAAVPWHGPPVRLEGPIVVVADGPAAVVARDPGGRTPLWTATLWEHASSLWGKPPQLRAAGGGLLVAVARSHGTELEYVRRIDGGRWPGWPEEPPFLTSGLVDLPAADSDADTVYVPAGGELIAVRLSDGGVRWRVPLHSPGRWRVRCGSRAVVLVPEAAVLSEPFADVAIRAAMRFLARPHAGRLPVLLLGLYDAWAGRAVPVVRLDPATGRTLGRLDLPAAGPACGCHLGPGPAVVATATAAYWLN